MKLHPRCVFRDNIPPAVPDDRLIKECEDLNIPTDLKRDEQFSVFIESHNEMAADLIEIFLSKFEFHHLLINLKYKVTSA